MDVQLLCKSGCTLEGFGERPGMGCLVLTIELYRNSLYSLSIDQEATGDHPERGSLCQRVEKGCFSGKDQYLGKSLE